MKSASDFLSEANSTVEKMDTQTAIARHGEANVVFIDVRDGKEIDYRERSRVLKEFREFHRICGR